MAGQKTKSSLMAKLGDRFKKSFETVKGNETDYGFGDLPPKITNGIAKLTECKIGVYETGDNKGQCFFYADAVVVSPATATDYDLDLNPIGTVKTRGKRTKIGPEPICDTPKAPEGMAKTQEEHVDRMLNELRKLGVDTATMAPEDLEVTMQALKDAGIYLRFDTNRKKATKERNNPKTYHVWKGVIEYDPESNGVDDTQDDSPAAEASDNGTTHNDTPTDEFGDLDSLLAAANADDGPAQEKLKEMAMSAGYTEEEADNTTSWDELVELINNPKSDDDSPAQSSEEGKDTPAEEPAEFVPEVGEVHKYMPIDPKTKKPLIVDGKTKKGKSVDCEVTEVNADKKTATLKNMVDKKTVYKNVKWSDIATT